MKWDLIHSNKINFKSSYTDIDSYNYVSKTCEVALKLKLPKLKELLQYGFLTVLFYGTCFICDSSLAISSIF